MPDFGTRLVKDSNTKDELNSSSPIETCQQYSISTVPLTSPNIQPSGSSTTILLNGLSYIGAQGCIRRQKKNAESESLQFVRSKYANCTPVLGSQLKKIVDAYQQPAFITSTALKDPQKFQFKHGSANISSILLCWRSQMLHSWK